MVEHVAPVTLLLIAARTNEDQGTAARLARHLAPLVASGAVMLWQNTGDRDETAARLRDATVVLFLVSPDLVSECNEEISISIREAEKRVVRIVPILARPVVPSPFPSIPALPHGQALSSYRWEDEGFVEVLRGLRGLLHELAQRPATRSAQSQTKGTAPTASAASRPMMEGADERTVLVLEANPKDRPRQRTNEELGEIERALRKSRLRVQPHLAVQVSDLPHLLVTHRPEIVHFCGEGNEAGELILHGETGKAASVPQEPLAKLFALIASAQTPVRVVVLNGCYTEALALALVEHVKYVVGVGSTIVGDSARTFAKEFYTALASDADNVKQAFARGCIQIGLNKLPDANQLRLFGPEDRPQR